MDSPLFRTRRSSRRALYACRRSFQQPLHPVRRKEQIVYAENGSKLNRSRLTQPRNSGFLRRCDFNPGTSAV